MDAVVVDDGRGGHDLEVRAAGFAPPVGTSIGRPAHGNYSGVWLSRYEYFSSGRDGAFIGLHYVVVLQHGDRLTVRSLPGSSDSPLHMDLTVVGTVVPERGRNRPRSTVITEEPDTTGRSGCRPIPPSGA